MPKAPPTQPSLLARLRDTRDERAWALFVDLYAPLVYGYARRRGLQDADAADLTQIVLRVVVSAIRRLEYDPQRGSFRSWLFTLVHNQLCNWRRRKHDFCRGSGDSSTWSLLENLPAPEEEGAGWDNEYEQRLFVWAAEQVRPLVRETTWLAFWQTAVEGKVVKEVAAALGLSEAAVYLARSRVMARLKTALQQARDSET